MALLPLRLFRGNVADDLVETFSGYTDLAVPTPAQPVEANYSGAAVTIAPNGLAFLTWDTLVNGTELLDRSVPAHPTLLDAGTYAVTIDVRTAALLGLPGSYFELLDGKAPANPFSAPIQARPGDNDDEGLLTTVQVWDGGALSVRAANLAVAPQDFHFYRVTLVKLS